MRLPVGKSMTIYGKPRHWTLRWVQKIKGKINRWKHRHDTLIISKNESGDITLAGTALQNIQVIGDVQVVEVLDLFANLTVDGTLYTGHTIHTTDFWLTVTGDFEVGKNDG